MVHIYNFLGEYENLLAKVFWYQLNGTPSQNGSFGQKCIMRANTGWLVMLGFGLINCQGDYGRLLSRYCTTTR